MSSIQSRSLTAGQSPQQNTLSDSQFSGYVKKQSFSTYESLDTGLTIKTKEGDLVTLSSNTYSKMDAFMYNSRGVMQTSDGKATMTQNLREITLASGENFAFSVAGDLNEQELQDVEAIVKGIDGVISGMTRGSMDDAVAAALSMGGYDSIAAYSADISYEKSYAMTSEVAAKNINTGPGSIPGTASQLRGQNSISRKNNSMENLGKFIEKMAETIDKLDERMMDKVQKPIDKLFRHHLGQLEEGKHGQSTSLYNAVEKAGQKINQMIEESAGKIFKAMLINLPAGE